MTDDPILELPTFICPVCDWAGNIDEADLADGEIPVCPVDGTELVGEGEDMLAEEDDQDEVEEID